jgi:S1-C subfamily serine protease
MPSSTLAETLAVRRLSSGPWCFEAAEHFSCIRQRRARTLDLQPLSVVARRFRGQRELRLDRLETVVRDGFLAPPAEDIALVFLDSTVAGVTPAPIAGPTYLAGLDLTKATFTAVGYGADGFVTGTVISNHPIVLDDGIRSYRDVTAITEHDAFPDRFLKITQSVCFGDSGGPLFHNGTVVALNTWTFSPRCTGPNLEYRVDSAAARSFLAAHL